MQQLLWMMHASDAGGFNTHLFSPAMSLCPSRWPHSLALLLYCLPVQSPNGAVHFARMRLAMEGRGNSSACIHAGSCLPLGGHSVLATLPRLPLPPPPSPPPNKGSTEARAAAAAGDGLPAIWVLSQFDSSALFHEAAVGAESPASGLIAMLAAAQLLGSAGGAARYRRRLVFAALAGEPWGLMGSKRLLWELEAGNSSMAGFSLAPGSMAGVSCRGLQAGALWDCLLHACMLPRCTASPASHFVSSRPLLQVLEVGPVGRAQRHGGGIQLYAHYPRDTSSSSGDGGYSPPAELLGALEAAAGSATEVGPGGVALERASKATPGLPPTASAGSFVRVASGDSGSTGGTVPAVLLSDFDAAFRGSTFQSQHDTADTVDADSIAATAVVLARAAHALALGSGAGTGSSCSSSGSGSGAEPAAEAEQQLPVDYAALKGTVEGLMQVGAACLPACRLSRLSVCRQPAPALPPL
jgi:nicastrin